MTCRTCSTASTAAPRRAARPGSGLGLAIVRQVAVQQGGSVTAEPAPGGGTLMRLRLPGAERVHAGQGEPAPAGAGSALAPAGAENE